MALTCVVEPGNRQIAALVGEFGAVEVWRGMLAGPREGPFGCRARELRLAEVERAADRHGIRFVVPGEPQWPAGLADLDGCEPVQDLGGQPFGLWLRGGRATLPGDRGVAVVGSRAATPYGETTASELAAELGSVGLTVISGGVYGIDAAAHRGALAVGAPTVAVMAGGLDKPYPPGNAGLLQRIAAEGLLVGELPPGQHPTRVRFLARNRLIAALAPGTVLVEAAERSGARNTVSWASACHRHVMAVPGPVHSVNSVTPHRLIREAEAVLVASAGDVVELLSPIGREPRVRPSQHRPLDDLTREELVVYEALPSRGNLDAGEVALRAGVPLGSCLGILDGLARRGFVTQHGGGGWQLAR